MIVMCCRVEYLGNGQGWTEEGQKAIKSLPDPGCYTRYVEAEIVDIVGDIVNRMFYDADYDVLYWVADLAVVAKGVYTKCPRIPDVGWDAFPNREVEIELIDCQHQQAPVCYMTDEPEVLPLSFKLEKLG